MVAASRVSGIIVLLVLAGALLAGYTLYRGSSISTTSTSGLVNCGPPGSSAKLVYTAAKTQFGAVSEFALAGPSKLSNGITVAQDGSVWFGMEAVPGVGHLFSNGTVVEYAWPIAAGCAAELNGYRTGIWGVAVWNGRVWATDSDFSLLVGLDPNDGSTRILNVSGMAPNPYTLTNSGNSLWFTSLSSPARLGRVGTDLSLSYYSVEGVGKQEPLQLGAVSEVNGNVIGQLVALDPYSSSGAGNLYGFSGSLASRTLNVEAIGGSFKLVDPDSVSYSSGIDWVAQHGPSSVVSYNSTDQKWTVWPTSLPGFTPTSLPYFVLGSGGTVWFNEHYANKIARLDSVSGTLTEFSEANPAIDNASKIQNDLTIARSENGLWFTSTSGNYIGFVDENYRPSFSLWATGGNTAEIPRGTKITLAFQVMGSWSTALQVGASDSETYNSIPNLISVTPNSSSLPAGSGPAVLKVDVGAQSSIAPGKYVVAVTVSDGLIFQSAYVFLTVV